LRWGLGHCIHGNADLQLWRWRYVLHADAVRSAHSQRWCHVMVYSGSQSVPDNHFEIALIHSPCFPW
jgi:hypothetical protein